jgi:hypothetical protein
MTIMIVNPGACGFTCSVKVTKLDKYRATVELASQCKQIQRLAQMLQEVDFLGIYRGPFGQNIVSQSAAQCKCHPSCPIPCSVIKAIEGELGMAVKKDVEFNYKE